MAVQRINSTVSPGWQARVGAASRFFADRKHGGAEQAEALARREERRLQRERGTPARRLQRNNTSQVAGLRPSWAPSAAPGGVPVLRIQASWSWRGRKYSTCYSTQKHGLLGAVERAIEAREKGTRQSMGITARQAWARMRHLTEGSDKQ